MQSARPVKPCRRGKIPEAAASRDSPRSRASRAQAPAKKRRTRRAGLSRCRESWQIQQEPHQGRMGRGLLQPAARELQGRAQRWGHGLGPLSGQILSPQAARAAGQPRESAWDQKAPRFWATLRVRRKVARAPARTRARPSPKAAT